MYCVDITGCMNFVRAVGSHLRNFITLYMCISIPTHPPLSLSLSFSHSLTHKHTHNWLAPSIYPKVSTAMEILKVMAEEMDKDRKRAFELQGKLDKFRKGATTKGKRVYLPDPCEAAEKKVTKLEELYDTALTEVQVKYYTLCKYTCISTFEGPSYMSQTLEKLILISMYMYLSMFGLSTFQN